MNPAAVLSILVKTTGAQVAAKQLLAVDSAGKSAGGSLDKFAKSTKGAAVGFGVVAAAGGAFVAVGARVIKTAANYEKAMAEVKAVSGATASEMDKLSKAALSLGQKSGLGATKAAQAIAELAKGGLAASDIIGGGLAGAMALAQAGGLELADAATGTANALNLFSLRAKDATHVADAFATAANATTADVGDFTLALSQGGAAAKAAGLSFDQTTVALEALASVGVKGSDAGTSLKSALTQLANPTKKAANEARDLGLQFFDAHGKMKTLGDISEMLRSKLGGLTNQQRLEAAATLVGTDGMRALLALYDAGPKKLDAFEQGLKRQGSAAEVAAQKQAGFTGAMNRFRATVETLSIKLGTALLPSLTSALQALTKFVQEMETGKGQGGEFARTMTDVAGAIGDVSHATASVVSWMHKHELAWDVVSDVIEKPINQLRGLIVIFNGIKKAGEAVLGVFKDIGSAIGRLGSIAKGAGSLNPFGDGLGKIKPPSIPNFGGGLMGARPSMAPFAAAGARFGLRVSSGRRPGAITSSGNVSYHSSGEAIDMAGSPAGMLGYFRQMRAKYGSRLAELIYTPGGIGVKNGQPFRYTGKVAADHFDHVHVAFDSGVPGVGDGIGQIKALWTRAGGSASAQNMAAAIAMAESGGNPNISHKNSDGSIDRGLWQINSVHGALSTFSRLGNARAAVQISGNGRNWNPWTVYRTGAYKRFLGAAGKAKSKAGSKSKGAPTITGAPMKPATYDQITAALDLAVAKAGGQDNPAALGALIDRRRALSERAAKINKALRKKNLRPETRARLQTELSGLLGQAREMDAQIGSLMNPTPADTGTGEDPNQPLIDAINAAAEIEKQRIELETQLQANQLKIIALAQQGPEILGAVIAAVNGGIGGRVGLGLQTPGYAGSVAKYGGSAGRL